MSAAEENLGLHTNNSLGDPLIKRGYIDIQFEQVIPLSDSTEWPAR
jgi:hypothetical protein